MAVRFKEKCRFCPDAQPANSTPKLKRKPNTTNTILSISTPAEGQRLWKHVLFGTSTCISMIEGYAALGMPGDPCCALKELRDRIGNIIANIEGTNANHGQAADERHAPPDRSPRENAEG
jgi:hypothetical protein